MKMIDQFNPINLTHSINSQFRTPWAIGGVVIMPMAGHSPCEAFSVRRCGRGRHMPLVTLPRAPPPEGS